MLLSVADLERHVRPLLTTLLSMYLGVGLAVSIAAAPAGREAAAGRSICCFVCRTGGRRDVPEYGRCLRSGGDCSTAPHSRRSGRLLT